MNAERPPQPNDAAYSRGGQALRRSEVVMAGGAFALSVALTIVLVAFREPLQHLGEWSYAGAFAVMLLNSATIIFPAFGQGFVVAVAESLNPYLLAVVGGAGATLGELSGYIVGAAGNRLVRGRGAVRVGRSAAARLAGPGAVRVRGDADTVRRGGVVGGGDALSAVAVLGRGCFPARW